LARRRALGAPIFICLAPATPTASSRRVHGSAKAAAVTMAIWTKLDGWDGLVKNVNYKNYLRYLLGFIFL
jgi:hypothetical protein